MVFLDGKVCSVALKLWLITSPVWWVITYSSALTICGKPVTPSVSETGVSTRTMLAPGAIVWAYSTSRVVSPAHPTMSELLLLKGGTLPAGWRILNDGGAGRPNVVSKTLRSLVMGGEPEGTQGTVAGPFPG